MASEDDNLDGCKAKVQFASRALAEQEKQPNGNKSNP
jgi:hypothetical protein